MPGKIIGFSGFKGAGKNTAADLVRDEHRMMELAAFADPLRDMIETIDPVVTNHDGEPSLYRYSDAIAGYGYDHAKEEFPEIRRFIQVLGTEAIRDLLGEAYGLTEMLGAAPCTAIMRRRIIEAAVDHDWGIIITDVRFPDELALIQGLGGTVYNIVRPGRNGDSHRSEQGLSGSPGVIDVPNTGNLIALHDALVKAGAIEYTQTEGGADD